MSAKKDTKIFEDENTDSGFLSGPLSEQNLSEEFEREEESKRKHEKKSRGGSSLKDVKSISKDVKSSSKDVLSEDYDSGLISMECLSGELDVEQEPVHVPEQPLIVIDSDDSPSNVSSSQHKLDIPLIRILFEQDEDGDTQLHIAAVRGCEKSVATLIRVCPDRELLDIRNSFGHTALHLAVLAGFPYVTKMLVAAGASIGIRDYNGETPLHLAVQHKHIKSLKYLLSSNIGRKKLATVLDQKNYTGQACIHIAASRGFLDEIKMLISHGANINLQENLAGRTALHISAQRGDATLVSCLCRAGAAQRTRDYAGRTPRRLARRSNVAHLLQDGSDDESSDSEYESESELFEEMMQMMAATTC